MIEDKSYIQALMEGPSTGEDATFAEARKQSLPRMQKRWRELMDWLRQSYIQPMRRWCRTTRQYQFGARIGVLTRSRSTKRARIYQKKNI